MEEERGREDTIVKIDCDLSPEPYSILFVQLGIPIVKCAWCIPCDYPCD